ncbi:nicotinate-nucleotide--dimethylbenzimidazole phosphoribosyltransferase [Echinicola sp. CAU 1574]|uniref:Nicotinate-nucleotide--dimethylbenzimidazole phosphoribosyltransferase n=1 Tax=Echinicola arenosa TaxID=2774144 RepID=A0ABR9APX3_9BACT|nr:nicotinate-nucleotide--dimethylbenzimidazole phosphoribosyltransferase [Echinicola arenosa]MBD8490843.1 nicotinate-nucleotide--dimethylbenzimidazole phosphoribosyltransferase [Echinicola arenosa]
MIDFNITPINLEIKEKLQSKIDGKTKPVGALGQLEELALQIGLIQQSTSPELKKPHIVVFAGDHGIAKTGLVNPYPQEVTFQMVMNFISGGAAINVLAKQNNIAVKVVDAGVNHDFGNLPGLVNAKIALGTKNYLEEPAMSTEQANEAIQMGANIVEEIFTNGCNVIGFGEMGIGNTSSAALIMHYICDMPLENCVGKGTGTNLKQQKTKLQTLKKAVDKHKNSNINNHFSILTTFGGLEIAQICGGMLKAAEKRMTILVDGFITTAALLIASKINPNILPYCIFTHCSDEKGHRAMLEFLNSKPILHLNMRLGEGSGAAVAYPIVLAACTFLNQMASFESAGVSQAK